MSSTLAAFAENLRVGAVSLEMDGQSHPRFSCHTVTQPLSIVLTDISVGITKDGHPIVWHDEKIDKIKCKDTAPAYDNDPLYPYVGRNVANLTLAQIKTLDCGSLRLNDFPLQGTYRFPGQWARR
jgi:hypothetical protein